MTTEKVTENSQDAALPSWHAERIRRRARPMLSPMKKLVLLVLAVWMYAWLRASSLLPSARKHVDAEYDLQLSNECPQVDAWRPSERKRLFQSLENVRGGLPSTPPPQELAELLSGAVQVNTSSYDNYPIPVSAYPALWSAVFAPFRAYLYKAFPEVHFAKAISLQHVNEHGLLYTWQGKNATLKPIVFMAHQDVVPVEPETLSLWDHGAFSGYIDKEKGLVYGRGASDDKASLTMLLAAFTSLLKSGFQPERTIVLSFGFDEETSGTQGAQALAERLESVYGTHIEGKGVYMIVDEGNSVDADMYGLQVAGPAVAEKGYLDAQITVHAPGGHSSVPPQHTSIGILSRVVAAIEDSPWKGTVAVREQTGREDSPGLRTLLCLRDAPAMRHSKKNEALRDALDGFVESRTALRKVESAMAGSCRSNLKAIISARRQLKARGRFEKARARLEQILRFNEDFVTTQAVDLISGGVKINALPEQASVVINHRISVEESVSDVRKHLLKIVGKVADKYGYDVEAWNSSSSAVTRQGKSSRYIVLKDAFESALEPAPRTPTQGNEASPFRLLSSVILHTYEGDGERRMRVVPTLMGGNTDTKSYWRLSKHIFRFAPTSLKPLPKGRKDDGIHTVNEFVQIDTLTVGHRFYTAMMVAAQEEEHA